MDEMSNYVASEWKRDLTYIISCCWAAQVGPLDSEEWQVAIHKFLAVMRNKRAIEWMDIKELSPLQFMPYVAKQFKNITGKDSWASSKPALTSKGNRYPKDPWPNQADDLTHRGQPKLGPQQLEPLEGIRMEPN